MKKKVILVAMIMLLLSTTAWGQATNFNIFGIPNADWFSGNNSPRDIPMEWMRTIDPLVASSGGANAGTSSYLYVDSEVTNAGDGTSWLNAVATLNEAVDLASTGDVIYITQSSAETMGAAADEVDLDVDGLTIIGIGNGEDAPLFDYTGDVSGAFTIGADNITLVNLRFKANILDVNDAIYVDAGSTHITIADCWFGVDSAGTDEFHEVIDANTAGNHFLTIVGCEFAMGAGASRCAIAFLDSDYARIVGNKFSGDYAVADINNVTTASDHITITGNEISNATIGGAAGLNALPCITLVATTSGIAANNIFVCNVASPAAAIVGADMWVFNNIYSETEGGVPAAPSWFASDTVQNVIGLDDASNLGVTTSVTADVDGTILERLEDLSDRQLGTTLIAGKSYTVTAATASVIATTSPLFTVAGGPIMITDLFGIVTTEMGATNMTIQGIDTATSTTFPFSDDVTLDSDVVGTTYTFTGAVPSVLTPLAGPQNRSATSNLQWYMPAGTVDQLGDGAVAGVIMWYMTFIPLVEGVTVVDGT